MKPYYKNELTTIYNGDCLAVMDYLIEQGVKVDAIITDPPYGILNGMKLKGSNFDINNILHENVEWDNKLDWVTIWDKLNNLIKLNGNIILFNQVPSSHYMINPNVSNLNHELIWLKSGSAHGMLAKIQPLKIHENIYVFRRKIDRDIQLWFHNEFDKTKMSRKSFNERMGFATTGGGVSSAWFSDVKIDWQLMSHEQYLQIQKIFPNQFKCDYNSFAVENSFYGENEKSFISVSNDMTGLHPTQKPLELMKYLIETYTKKDDLILDFTSGSFTTCVGADQLGRRSIGIEMSKDYCNIGIKRLESLQMRLDI